MRVHLLSDLHNEFDPFNPIAQRDRLILTDPDHGLSDPAVAAELTHKLEMTA